MTKEKVTVEEITFTVEEENSLHPNTKDIYRFCQDPFYYS